MDVTEIRMRCIEAAAKTPAVHTDGHAAGVLKTAEVWAAWILGRPAAVEAKGLAAKIKDLY